MDSGGTRDRTLRGGGTTHYTFTAIAYTEECPVHRSVEWSARGGAAMLSRVSVSLRHRGIGGEPWAGP